jgi:hypothetical protein
MNIFENIQKKLEDLVKAKQALLYRNKRKDAYSMSPDQLLKIYQNYFIDIPYTGNYIFKFSKNDKNDLLFLFRVYFKMYVELKPVQGTDIIPTTQINYQYIKPHKI